jgi:CoA:oxalate CoA-transferase
VKGFDGLRVVEVAEGIGGPFCGQFLADRGAAVVKVEPPSGDWARTLGPPFVDGVSPTYLCANQGKRSISVDIRTDSGAQLVRELAAEADVFIAGYRPGALERRGLGAADLLPANARLVHCSLSGFGNRGLKRERPGSDTILQAYSGLMSITGQEDAGPTRVGTPIADTAAGIYCALAITTMLLRREATGVGGTCDTSLLETLIHLEGVAFASYFAGATQERRGGRSSLAAVPAEAVATSDGWVILSCHSPRQWERLCTAIGRPAWATQPGMATNAERVERHEAVMTEIGAVLATRTTASWMGEFVTHGVNADVVNTLDSVVADPHVMSLGIFEPTSGAATHVGSPFTFDGERELPGDRRAPLLGEHSAQIARELGYDEDGVSALFADRVLHTDAPRHNDESKESS